MIIPIRILLCLIFFVFSPAAQAQLRLLLPPVSSPATMYAAFAPLAAYLGKATGETVTLHFSANLDSFYAEAKMPVAQVTFFCPIAYLKVAHEDRYFPLAEVNPTPGGNRSVILVRRDSPIHNVLQLRGSSFVAGDPACAASSLIPLTLLQEAGLTPKDFHVFRQTGSDQSALMDVAARFYDATAVAENVAAPYLRAGTLRVIGQAPVGPGDLLAASGKVPAPLRARLTTALLAATRNAPEAMTALAGMVRGFQPVQDGDYAVLRTLYADLFGVALTPKRNSMAMSFAIPPTYTPMAAYQIFAPLREALARAIGHPVRLVIPANEEDFVQQGRRGAYDFSLLTPAMVAAERHTMTPLAPSLPNPGAQRIAIIAREPVSLAVQALQPPLRIAYAGPYCSAREAALPALHSRERGTQPFIWKAVGSERAVFTSVANGSTDLGIVRAATFSSLDQALPGAWTVLMTVGTAAPWSFAVNRHFSPAQRQALLQAMLHLAPNALSGAGFARFIPIPHE